MVWAPLDRSPIILPPPQRRVSEGRHGEPLRKACLKLWRIIPFFQHLGDYETWRCGMARIGYARVSSVGQSLEIQLAKLVDCDKIYQEKRSGAAGKRPRLDACLEYVREGIRWSSPVWIGSRAR